MDLLLVGSDEEHLDTCTAVCMCVRMRISMQVVYYVVVASWVLVLGFAAGMHAELGAGCMWLHSSTSRAPSELGAHMDFLFAPSHAKLASVRSA